MKKGKNDKIRLHKITREHLKEQNNGDYTAPEIQRNIAENGVLVDGQLIKNRLEWIYPFQTISINWPKRSHGNFEDIKILQETNDYLVIFKPGGVVVQAGSGHQKDNLVEWLLQHQPSQKNFDSEVYPGRGLVHRLDKLTQGILLVAKNEQTLKFFQNQFRNREVKKKYLAIVTGELNQSYHIKNYQARNKNQPTKNKLFWDKNEAVRYDPKARNAESYFRPLFISRQRSQTICEVEIKTGRMHQIRLQAQAIGHALVADPKYPQIENTIPKAHISTDINFDTGVLNIENKDLHVINKQEFLELKYSIFGDTDFCLLSNYIKLQNPKGDNLEVMYFQ